MFNFSVFIARADSLELLCVSTSAGTTMIDVWSYV